MEPTASLSNKKAMGGRSKQSAGAHRSMCPDIIKSETATGRSRGSSGSYVANASLSQRTGENQREIPTFTRWARSRTRVRARPVRMPAELRDALSRARLRTSLLVILVPTILIFCAPTTCYQVTDGAHHRAPRSNSASQMNLLRVVRPQPAPGQFVSAVQPVGASSQDTSPDEDPQMVADAAQQQVMMISGQQQSQLDWAQRLSSASLRQNFVPPAENLLMSSWPPIAIESQIMTTKPTSQNQTLLGNLFGKTLVQHHQNPLSRAIEVTKMFVRQIAPQSSSQQSEPSHLPSLFDPSAPYGHLVAEDSATLPAQKTGKLYNFFFQPKTQPMQPHTDVKESVLPPRAEPERIANGSSPANNTDIFQLASSEGNLQLSPDMRGRSMVTLSAPYEHGPRPNSPLILLEKSHTDRSSGNMLPSASGQRPATVNASALRANSVDTKRPEWQIGSQMDQGVSFERDEADASGFTSKSQRDESQVEDANVVWEASRSPANQQGEPHGELHYDGSMRVEPKQVVLVSRVYPTEDGNQTGALPADQPARNGTVALMQRLTNSTTAYLVPSEDPSPDGPQVEEEVMKESPPEGAGTADDDALLGVQLPSQYDSVIRAPPEGHYDDYYKPVDGSPMFGDNDTIPSGAFDDGTGHSNSTEGNYQIQHASAGDEGTGNTSNHSSQADQHHLHGPDYTHQYYLSQQPLKHTSVGDRTVEFVTIHSPKNPKTGIGGVSKSDYTPQSLPSNAYYQAPDGLASPSNNVTSSPPNNERYVVINQSDKAERAGSATNGTHEDNIQLIVANTNDQMHDPNTNEKVITYTSEGNGNLARLIGKPARVTFYNKDLNELPLQPPVAVSTPSSIAGRHATGKPRSTRSPASDPGRQLAAATRPPIEVNSSNQRSSDVYPDGTPEMFDPVQKEESEESQFGRYTGGVGPRRAPGVGPSGDDRGMMMRLSAPASRHSSDQSANTSDRKVSRHVVRPPGHAQGRPQVTEARFQLKDLPLNPPTPMPSVIDETTKSIAELPEKAKRLRDHQVDKNELMSELLTALDRVKAAIYKLQPLTAKMNAMYRKSVTSNTRNHILDHHKGTYAKRYPPGDYDDSYDRMRISDMVDRQRGTSWTSRSSNDTSNRRSEPRRSLLRNYDETRRGDIATDDSRASAIYLPAPRQMLSEMLRNSTGSQATVSPNRMGDSWQADRVEPRLQANGSDFQHGSNSSTDQVMYDDDEEDGAWPAADQFHRRQGDSRYELIGGDHNGNLSTWNVENSEPDERGPLFGYRITIYQTPGEVQEGTTDQETSADDSRTNRIVSYSLVDDGRGDPVEFSSLDDSGGPVELALSDDGAADSMATSESSLVPLNQESGQLDGDESQPGAIQAADDEDEEAGADETDGDRVGSESGKSMLKFKKKKMMKKKSMEEEHSHKKKKGKKKGSKEGEKHSKHQAHKKKGHEEHKKKKEFKKIKHHKGLMSKESHKLHRDKHIKAHDRGAAKEKALKERTQIEFFEREQIVDDEFEKGKKSTMKAGWASGHDMKKESHSKGDKHYDDGMSMGGSQQVDQVVEPAGGDEISQPAASASSLAPMMMDSAASEHHHKTDHGKGKSHSMESSSGKQSNKYEKKHMEAKGKKFKGWREKGYKIITETEFIDRGSLHDSAYKKRDKGAAHHQKFKKKESKSEGHQGTMHEHHKKSHKKEEKKSKSEEKKKEMMGKDGAEEAKKGHKKKKKESKKGDHKKHEKKHEDHEKSESAPELAASLPTLPPVGAFKTTLHREPKYTRIDPIKGPNPDLTEAGNHSQLPLNLTRDSARQRKLQTALAETGSLNDENSPGYRRQPEATGAARIRQNPRHKPEPGGPSNVKTQPDSPRAPFDSKSNLLQGSNATLLDIIDRLNISRSDRGTFESANAGHKVNSTSRRAEVATNLSPLVRLVNNLARLNETLAGSRRPSTSPKGPNLQTNLVKPHSHTANKVQFDDQVATLGAVSRKHHQAYPSVWQNNGQAQSRQSRLIVPPDDGRNIAAERQPDVPHLDLLAPPPPGLQGAPAGAFPSPFQFGQQPSDLYPHPLDIQQLLNKQYYLPSQQFDNLPQQSRQHQLALNMPDPTFGFIDPQVPDYDSLPLVTGSSNYQQVSGSESVPPMNLFGSEASQHLQQFDFLTD